jgi:erythromycin esterase
MVLVLLSVTGCQNVIQGTQSTGTVAPTAITTSTPTPLVIPDEVIKWLQANAVPFDTAEPGHGCEDMQPLLNMIGEARIVAIGEATHGTHEFKVIEQRIFECLVTEKNFNILATEIDWPLGNRVNDYIQTGNGIPSLLIKSVPLFDTNEFQNSIGWIRQYNANLDHINKITFRGFDIFSANLNYQDLKKYIEATDPDSGSTIVANMNCFRVYGIQYPEPYYATRNVEIKAQCQEGLQAVYDYLVSHQADYVLKSSPEKYAEAVHAIHILMQDEHYAANINQITPDIASLRDQYMAENVKWLMEQANSNTKMVIWAHDGHIQTTSFHDEWQRVTYSTMGVYLRVMYGNDLVTIGTSFNRGQFNSYAYNSITQEWGSLQTFTAPTLLPNSHEEYLSKVDLPHYILDLRTTFTDPMVAYWFNEPRWLQIHGNRYDPHNLGLNFEFFILPKAFDILVYFENTTPSLLR